MTEVTPRRSLTDSPWYWLYVFCTAALVALVLMGPKYQARQMQLERNFQGRERANQQAAGQTPDFPLTEHGNTIVRLEPFYVGFGALLIGAWGILWWQHFYRGGSHSAEAAEPVPTEPDSADERESAVATTARGPDRGPPRESKGDGPL